jgi:hypothetical protein
MAEEAKALDDAAAAAAAAEAAPTEVATTPRMLAGFQRLLDVLIDRTGEEAAFIDGLLQFPALARVFVPANATTSAIYHKVIMLQGGGGVVFDSFDALVHTGTQVDELKQLANANAKKFKSISPADLARNWSKYQLYPDPQRKLEKRWLAAFTKMARGLDQNTK